MLLVLLLLLLLLLLLEALMCRIYRFGGGAQEPEASLSLSRECLFVQRALHRQMCGASDELQPARLAN